MIRNSEIIWYKAYSEAWSYSKDISQEWEDFTAIISQLFFIQSWNVYCIIYETPSISGIVPSQLRSAYGRQNRNSIPSPLSIYHHLQFTATFNISSLTVPNKQWCYIWGWLYRDLIVHFLVSATTFFPFTSGIGFCGNLHLLSQNSL